MRGDKMGIIFAIGGGEIRDLETLDIDRKIVNASKKANPTALFIPTASGESQEYIESFNYLYGEKLGCKIEVLLLLDGKTSLDEAKEKISCSDIIYVGGGNTKKMIEVWKMYDIDIFLKEAYAGGKILSGLSAGSICWFKSGHSDSESFETTGQWNYSRVEGLDLINAMHCPHYNEDTREEDFNKMILEYDEIGIAIDNNCAIEFNDNKYIIHKSDTKAKAYKVFLRNECVIREALFNTTDYRPMRELLSR
jgi:dipeptidase E